ncbi:hypothetical protein LSH36_46g04000 [Paralvinella palmiformis]|uniref:H15 domain-containing protein n=1 Tax=Paralvinella palmiformis TaxID=53620 RepID=A0AAD9K7Z9_9ANNE|nr:hypothetical protein LSH36_46g04000 [Paralvinella palmiformis]
MSDEDQVVKKAAPKKPSLNPNTVDMVLEAITALDDRKGVSIPAIKSFILEKYPTVDPAMLKHRLKKAIEKAMVGELITRPKSSDQMGPSLNGRFHLNKAKKSALEKAKQPKSKLDADKPKAKKRKTSEVKAKITKKTDEKTKKAIAKKLDVSKKLVKDAKKTVVKKADAKKKLLKSAIKTNPKTPVKVQKKAKEAKVKAASKPSKKATAKK